MSTQIKVGVIGTSGWTEMMFLPPINNHPTALVSAICGRNRERGEALAKTYGIPQVFTDYRTMIAEGNLDAIVVATPDDLHFDMTMAALDAGLHVLCEKPLALTVDHARLMTEKAEATGVKHMVLFTWRWPPHFQYLKRLVDEGFIGKCYQANFRFLGGFGRTTDYAWRQDGNRANGVVSDLGAHMIDFAHHFVGDIAKVNANLRSHIEHDGLGGQPVPPVNDAADVALQFANGAQGMIQVSIMTYLADRFMEIVVELYGEDGTLECRYIPFGQQIAATIYGARQDEEAFTIQKLPPEYDAYKGNDDPMVYFRSESVGPRLFIDAILDDVPVLPDFRDGLKVQEVIEAALLSAREGRWVSLDAQ